jgi:DNA polymerase-3 subunit gamma/tau
MGMDGFSRRPGTGEQHGSKAMSYTVLARKYRPETFEDVVGQEWISRTLVNAIRKGRVAHAFLFSGPRGVGKTSMARILSKALNCKEGPTDKPCLTCDHCVGINRGNDVDVVEIDAASNRGIDHIRALRENVRYAPVSSRHKIYIIDEVHMLTTESFNALLKTLEEPPEHVKFIFATTEPQKMPETVRSRCQCFDFRRITQADITARLQGIADHESIDCDTGVLQRIAVLSRGGLRDAESLLDQIASLEEGRATFEALNALTGRLSPGDVGDLVDAILAEDVSSILAFVDKVFASGTQGEDLLKDLIDYWRALMLGAAGSVKEVAELLPGLEARCAEQAGKTDLDRILICLQIALETLRKGRWFDDERILTEMALLKMARISQTLGISDALDSLGTGQPPRANKRARGSAPLQPPPRRPAGGGKSPASGGPEPGPKAVGKAPGPGSPGPEVSNPASGSMPRGTAEMSISGFQKILGELEKDSKSLAAYLRGLQVRHAGSNAFELVLPQEGASSLFKPDSPEVKQKLRDASRNVFDRPFEFTFSREKCSGREDLPPIVKKTQDLFEGDLL